MTFVEPCLIVFHFEHSSLSWDPQECACLSMWALKEDQETSAVTRMTALVLSRVSDMVITMLKSSLS